jgi:hypothetical protein
MSTRIPESLRTQIDATDRRSCCYCLTSEAVSGIPLTYDHITPASRGGLTTFDNVCLACRTCNEFKTNTIRAVDPLTQESAPLFHPRQQRWQDHFAWSLDGTKVEGTTAIGRATVVALRMNHALIVAARRRWCAVGWHPPTTEPEPR